MGCTLNYPADKSVSRLHCKLKVFRDAENAIVCSVTDSSRFGTEVGLNRITNDSTIAKAGVQIRFGAGQSIATLVDDKLRVFPSSSEVHRAVGNNVAVSIEKSVADADYYVVEQVDETVVQSSEFLTALSSSKKIVRVAYFERLQSAFETAKADSTLHEAPDFRHFLPPFSGRLASMANNEAAEEDETETLTKHCLCPKEQRAALFASSRFYFTSPTTMARWQETLQRAGATCFNLFDCEPPQCLTDSLVRVVHDGEAISTRPQHWQKVTGLLRDAGVRTVASCEIALALLRCSTQVFTNIRQVDHDWLRNCAAICCAKTAAKRKAEPYESPEAKRCKSAQCDDDTQLLEPSSPLLISRKRATRMSNASQASQSFLQWLAPQTGKQKDDPKSNVSVNQSCSNSQNWLSGKPSDSRAALSKSQTKRPNDHNTSDQVSFSRIMHVLNESSGFIVRFFLLLNASSSCVFSNFLESPFWFMFTIYYRVFR